MVVVVTHESKMASYFPEAGYLNGRNSDMCSDVAGPSSSSGNKFEISDGSNTTCFYYLPTASTTGCHLGFKLTTAPVLPFGRVTRRSSCIRYITCVVLPETA